MPREPAPRSTSSLSKNTIPPSPAKKKRSIIQRKHWSMADERLIIENSTQVISGMVSATRVNMFGIGKNKVLSDIAKQQGEDRLFEKIKSLKK